MNRKSVIALPIPATDPVIKTFFSVSEMSSDKGLKLFDFFHILLYLWKSYEVTQIYHSYFQVALTIILNSIPIVELIGVVLDAVG